MPREYLIEGYSYRFEPNSKITEYATTNRRQRNVLTKRDTIFSVSESLTPSEFADFEEWVNVTLNGGADTFSGNYFDSDVETIADMTIVNGAYSFEYRSPSEIVVSYEIEVKDRDLTSGQNIYEIVTDGTTPFTYEYFNQFEQLINFNNFRP